MIYTFVVCLLLGLFAALWTEQLNVDAASAEYNYSASKPFRYDYDFQAFSERHRRTIAVLTPAQMERNLALMAATLFPNRTQTHNKLRNELTHRFRTHPGHSTSSPDGRQLVVTVPNVANYSKIVCVKCTGLNACPALNGLNIEEVYLPSELQLKGTCKVLDELGARVQGEVFGPGRTFRNTTDCNTMVMQYLCLFYGSNNYMYRNWCQFVEDVRDSNPANNKVAPRYPCRSFCVQVATTCAYDPLFVHLCSAIACPPTADDCTADPSIGGQRLAANLGCSMPFEADPYSPKNAGASNSKNWWHPLVWFATTLMATALSCV